MKVSLKVEAGGTLWRTSWVEAVVLAGGPLVSTVVSGMVCRVRAEPDLTGATPRWMLLGTAEVLTALVTLAWLSGGETSMAEVVGISSSIDSPNSRLADGWRPTCCTFGFSQEVSPLPCGAALDETRELALRELPPEEVEGAEA